MKKHILFLAMTLWSVVAFTQNTFPKNGLQNEAQIPVAVYASAVHISPEVKFEDGATILFKDGIVQWVKPGKVQPKGAVFKDYSGLTIYPSFIDLSSEYGIKTEKNKDRGRGPHLKSGKKGPYYWNDAVRPETHASELFKADKKKAKKYIAAGFGAVLTHNHDGIVRGTGALVSLADDQERKVVIQPQASAHYSFSKGSSQMTYPSSLMGSIALIRQYFSDVKWYKNPNNRDHQNFSLLAGIEQTDMSLWVDAGDALTVLRAEEVFPNEKLLLQVDNDIYQVANQLSSTTKLIVPLQFPKPVKIESPYEVDYLSLEDLKHWEWAPKAPKTLKDKNLPFAITMLGNKTAKDFWYNLHKAIEYGLSETDALRALTTQPAQFIEADKKAGKLKKGYIANFIVCSGNIFEDGKILENWTMGQKHTVKGLPQQDVSGIYTLIYGDETYDSLKISFDHNQNTAQLKKDSAKIMVGLNVEENFLNIELFQGTDSAQLALLTPEGKNWSGHILTDKIIDVKLIRKGDFSEDKKDKKKDKTPVFIPENYTYPLKAYGYENQPKPGNYIFKNATVWTNESQGIVKNTDVWVNNGKIMRVGKNITIPGATVVDATGKHLTSGIVDEHSHIAISKGVNEGGQSVSAEVSIEDVVNPWDVNIYRQLAGGVTASQLLHGSANPIGGRSALVKLKYGVSPRDFKIKNADKFIKFALGENVKQSNWGDHQTKRFPQTRMGVEQLMRDAFTRALDYREKRKAYGRLSTLEKSRTVKPAQDYELEILLEILDGKRFITCHSYVQSEINMLMKLAEEFGFRINTFTHILEGYKVADKMREHGVAGSTFSDWWAYKFEVNDAIPFNAALLHDAGVLTGINSDDAEMGRRLNQEAAKVVKYGGVSEEEAWKMVTLNPAKMLHLDGRMGSIKPGKDADVVLWSDNPLSIKAKAEMTLIDGTIYFDRSQQAEKEAAVHAEKMRIYRMMKDAVSKGEKPEAAKPKTQVEYHCMGEHH